jgi:hypothetical protein
LALMCRQFATAITTFLHLLGKSRQPRESASNENVYPVLRSGFGDIDAKIPLAFELIAGVCKQG